MRFLTSACENHHLSAVARGGRLDHHFGTWRASADQAQRALTRLHKPTGPETFTSCTMLFCCLLLRTDRSNDMRPRSTSYCDMLWPVHER